MSKRRIALVNSTLFVGGAERVIAHLAQWLDPQRYEVHVVTMKALGDIGEELAANGFRTHCLAPEKGEGLEKYLSSKRLVELARDEGIELLHSHDLHSMVDSCIARRVVGGLRHVHTFHFGNYPHMARKYLIMERLAGRFADRLVAVGEEQKKAIAATHGFREDRLSRIYNGVVESSPAPLREPLPEGRVVIGSINTLIEQKGMPVLLEAVNRLRGKHPNVLLVVAGDGPMRDELEAMVEELGMADHVRFLGWVENAGAKLLPHMDAFVQSSFWEAMSMVVLESMAAGVPGVVTTVGENARVIRDGETGLLVPPRDAEALANALDRVIADETLRHRLARQAQEDFQARFTAKTMASAYGSLYSSVLGVGQAGKTRVSS